MSVPGYQDFMLPLVRLASNGQELRITDAIEKLADEFHLSEEDRTRILPSGTQTQLYNRVTWAVTYLTKSQILEKPARGRFKITPRGLEVLKQNPGRIDNAFLMRFDEFKNFKSKKKKSDQSGDHRNGETELTIGSEVTPDEQMDFAYKDLREALADDLLTRVRAMSPKDFEQLVVDVLVAMGYGGSRMDAAQVVGKSGDGGIDGVIKEDRLGLDMVYIQAKRHEKDIGPGDVREFVGSLGEHKANKGVFITSGGFTSGARDAAAKAHSRIVLIDGDQLAQHMIDHGVGVAEHKTYVIKRLDSDYFGDL